MSTRQPNHPSTASGTATPAATALVTDDQVDDIVERLQRRYNTQQISRTDLEVKVRGSYHQFDGAPIRAFVNVFVERLVRRSVDDELAVTTAAAYK
ncbi:three-helix bundle dimerization domain-containing protein [Actinoplanes sp. CA-252034]|uniref:three-helix bundle dimerization domain-containing protein n=1 Tax=Actinoplanes sp. CA-252034 TaxID=3239906 RepID=UPI003D969279